MSRIAVALESGSTNAAAAWLLVAVLSVGAVANALEGDFLWTVYAAAVVAVALVPVALTGDASTLVSWDVLALAALPVLARRVGVVAEPLTYVSVAALALLVAVEVDAFSAAEMPHWFAVLFVVLTTLSVASLWAVLQYASDLWLSTDFLAGRVPLMWDLVAAAVAGVGAGVAFELYFRRYGASAVLRSEGVE